MNNQFDVNPPEATGDWISNGYGIWAILIILAICALWTWAEYRNKGDDPKKRDFCRDLPKKRLKMDYWRWDQECAECERQGYPVGDERYG